MKTQTQTHKPIAYILVGVPGSGKSTWIETAEISPGFLPQSWASIISTDKHVEAYAKKQNKTYSEVFDSVIKGATVMMLEELNAAIAVRGHIIWDQTNVSVKTRAQKLRMLKGYKKIAVVFPTPDAEELQLRLDSRKGKHIPKQVMQSMIDSFIMPTLEEGFDDIIVV